MNPVGNSFLNGESAASDDRDTICRFGFILGRVYSSRYLICALKERKIKSQKGSETPRLRTGFLFLADMV